MRLRSNNIGRLAPDAGTQHPSLRPQPTNNPLRAKRSRRRRQHRNKKCQPPAGNRLGHITASRPTPCRRPSRPRRGCRRITGNSNGLRLTRSLITTAKPGVYGPRFYYVLPPTYGQQVYYYVQPGYAQPGYPQPQYYRLYGQY